MKVCVCIKPAWEVFDTYFSSSRGEIDTSAAARQLPVAERLGIDLASQMSPDEIVAVSWTDAADESVLRQAAAVGATRLVRIECESPEADRMDPLVVSRVLVEVLKSVKPEMVFFGHRSPEGGSGAVGPMVAAMLGYALLPRCVKLWRDGDLITFRCLEDGREISGLARLPVVVTVHPAAGSPKSPSPLGIRRAMKTPLEVVRIDAQRSEMDIRAMGTNESKGRGRQVLEGSPAQMVQMLKAQLRERGAI